MENFEMQKRVRESRIKQGLSQEELAFKAGLSLRTVQRIENGESVPRGDTLKRLSITLQISPDDIIDWHISEDKNVLTILNLSQLGFLAFPLLGIIIPLTIWILKKDKVRHVNTVGISIINFQITWTLVLFLVYIIIALILIFHFSFGLSELSFVLLIGLLYLYNLIMIFKNTVLFNKTSIVKYKPYIKFLT